MRAGKRTMPVEVGMAGIARPGPLFAAAAWCSPGVDAVRGVLAAWMQS